MERRESSVYPFVCVTVVAKEASMVSEKAAGCVYMCRKGIEWLLPCVRVQPWRSDERGVAETVANEEMKVLLDGESGE